jgi:hypothetical protein
MQHLRTRTFTISTTDKIERREGKMLISEWHPLKVRVHADVNDHELARMLRRLANEIEAWDDEERRIARVS